MKKKKKGFRLKNLILILFVFWLCKSLISQRIVMGEAKKIKLEREAEVSQLEREIEELNKEIGEKDSLEFVEKIAREELKMVRPREIMYIDKNKEKKNFKFGGE